MMLNKRQTARFCSQLKMMLSSGMPLVEALIVIGGLAVNKKHHHQLENVINKIKEGYSLSESATGLLPPLAIGSLHAAERAGNLEETLERLAKYFESKAETEEKVKSALVYPVFVLALSLVSVCALLFFVLPGMRGLFSDLGTELPVFTSVILGFSDWLARFWPIVVGAPVAAGWFLSKRLGSEKVESFILRVPLLERMVKQEATIQGLGTLGALLNGGAPILEALTTTADSSHSVIFKRIIFKARDGVENGERLSDEFARSGFFPRETIQMLKVGENSGRLAEMLLNIADFQSKEREVLLKRYTALLEPAMTLVVGVVVGFVVLAMFLPVVNMISQLQ